MARIARQDILRTLREMVRRGEPIIGGGAGTGLSAKCEEAGGIDLIVIYNSGRYRMAGRGSISQKQTYAAACSSAGSAEGPLSWPLAAVSRSTNSITAIGAASPKRKPAFRTRR